MDKDTLMRIVDDAHAELGIAPMERSKMHQVFDFVELRKKYRGKEDNGFLMDHMFSLLTSEAKDKLLRSMREDKWD